MDVKIKPPCTYGSRCYRKNTQHFLTYSHPDDLKQNIPKKRGGKDNEVVKKPRLEKVEPPSPKKNDMQKCHTKLKQTTLQFGKKESDRNKKISNTTKQNQEKSSQSNDKAKEQKKNTALEDDITRKKSEQCCGNTNLKKVKESDDSGICESEEQSIASKTSAGNSGWVFIRKMSDDNEKKTTQDEKVDDKSVEEIIKHLFLVDMPQCFYSFFDFCKSNDCNKPENVLQICKLKMVGPFDVLLGKMNSSFDNELALCHWRYYYDPPEFQTVLATDSGFHIGYWRDDPNDLPVFLASNNSDKDCIFKSEAENIFGAVYHYMEGSIKTSDPFTKVKIKNLQSSLSEWAEKHEFTLEKSTPKMIARQKKVVTKSFHKLGIVVPVEKKTELGYRPLLITDANLKKACKLIMDADDEAERDSLWENLRPHITAANIANDECDFGMSLELGIDLFCMGSPLFHRSVEHLLSVAYALLNRSQFESIIKAHLKMRKTGHNLSVLSCK